MHPVFSLVQLYFIFKYGNVIVNKNRWLARFAFSHCISSCFSFWINTLLNETLDAIVLKYFPQQLGDGGYSGVTTTTTTTEDYRMMDTYFEDVVTHAGYDWTACAENGTGIGNNMRCVVSVYLWGVEAGSQVETRAHCSNNPEIYTIFNGATFLYPFSIEFNILVVAIW